MSYNKFINFSKKFFQVDEKIMKTEETNQLHETNVSSWNSINKDQGLNVQIPAYINQAHISTYYKDNPWPILESTKKYDLPTLGGSIRPFLPPGHKPGNVQK